MDKILVIAAHPDDEILGSGATVARCIKEGAQAYSLVLGEGITARYDRREDAPAGELQALDECYHKVCKHIGFSAFWHDNLPDNRFDTVPLLDIVKRVERVIAQVQPSMVFTHFEGDLNQDHRITAQAVLAACRPKQGGTVREVLAFEVPSSTEWAFSQALIPFRPNVFYNVSSTLERKIEAMKLYDSELAPFPHPRSPQSLRTIAERWGVVAGMPAAEAFVLLRQCR